MAGRWQPGRSNGMLLKSPWDDFLVKPVSYYEFTGQHSYQPEQFIGTKNSAWKTTFLLRMVLLVRIFWVKGTII